MSDLGTKYAEYLSEKFNTYIHESEHAFIAYQYIGENIVQIDVLHVDKEHRENGEGTSIWESFKKILPEKVDTCIAEIETLSNNPEIPLVAFIKRGFKVLSLDGSKIRIYNKFKGAVKRLNVFHGYGNRCLMGR